MIKSHGIVKEGHKNVNLFDKKSTHSEKSNENVNLFEKKSQQCKKKVTKM